MVESKIRGNPVNLSAHVVSYKHKCERVTAERREERRGTSRCPVRQVPGVVSGPISPQAEEEEKIEGGIGVSHFQRGEQ